MTDLPAVPQEIKAGVLSLLDLLTAFESIPDEVKTAAKAIHDLLDPPATTNTLREKVVAIIAVSRLSEDSFEIADEILGAVCLHIAGMDFVPNCGSSMDGSGCYVQDERASILNEIAKEI